MKNIRVASISLNQTPMDWEHNRARILNAARVAENENVQLICFPELAITGYGCEDMFHAPFVQERAVEELFEIANHLPDITTAIGLPIKRGSAVYNCIAVIDKGTIQGIVPKQNLAQDGLHYEPRWFKSWPREKSVELGGLCNRRLRDVPFGDLVFETRRGVRFGFEICEDAWVADRPGASLAHRNVDIILNPSASHFAFHKQEVRRGFVTEGSRTFGCGYIYANLLGNESGRIIYDGSTIIASNGEIISEGKRFSYRPFTVTTGDVDLDVLATTRTSREGFRPEDEIDFEPVKITGPLNEVTHDPSRNKRRTNERHLDDFERKVYEFEEAVSLALYDYMRKTSTSGYVVSLSGGADSSTVAVLVAEMFKKSGMIGDLSDVLTCVYQPTEISASEFQEAAEGLASELGAEFYNVPVGGIAEGYKDLIRDSMSIKEWDWDEYDIPLQNIQARSRAPSVWMVANLKNQILLATSNRSEAAVGYATMDGDTAGGLSPIAGIDKNFLLDYLEYKEKEVPSLKRVNRQEPTAELRPSDLDQTDESDLMPYDVLNFIENKAIGEKKSPEEIKDLASIRFKDTPEETLKAWIEKFFKLWCRNQWKRERFAVSFHLDDKNLDPKTWCRFPILSSGFGEELDELGGKDES